MAPLAPSLLRHGFQEATKAEGWHLPLAGVPFEETESQRFLYSLDMINLAPNQNLTQSGHYNRCVRAQTLMEACQAGESPTPKHKRHPQDYKHSRSDGQAQGLNSLADTCALTAQQYHRVSKSNCKVMNKEVDRRYRKNLRGKFAELRVALSALPESPSCTSDAVKYPQHLSKVSQAFSRAHAVALAISNPQQPSLNTALNKVLPQAAVVKQAIDYIESLEKSNRIILMEQRQLAEQLRALEGLLASKAAFECQSLSMQCSVPFDSGGNT